MHVFPTLLGYFTALQEWLTHLLVAYPLWSGLLTLVIVALEFLPVSGNIVPGAAILVAGGSLAAAGKVGLVPMLLGGTLGAILGLSLGYHVAWHYRATLWHWPIWRRHQATVDRTRQTFLKYGIWALIIGRGIPGVRVVIALLAGANGMPPKPFYVANVIGGALWVASHILIGYYGLKIFL